MVANRHTRYTFADGFNLKDDQSEYAMVLRTHTIPPPSCPRMTGNKPCGIFDVEPRFEGKVLYL